MGERTDWFFVKALAVALTFALIGTGLGYAATEAMTKHNSERVDR